jgi:hypothetical protein
VALAALGAMVGLVAGCFDSDEKYRPAVDPTTTTGLIPTTSSDSTTTSGSSSTTAEPDVTCRDAIACVFGCITQLQTSMLPEPDLTCFLECEPGLTADEVLHLFRLAECVTNVCIEIVPECDILVPTETTGTTTGDETSTGTTTGGGGPVNPCLDCVVARLLDPQPGGVCQPFADACK